MDSATFRVPASTSNCGPGFDSLGLALGLWNRVTVRLGGCGIRNLHGVGTHSGEALAGMISREFHRVTGVASPDFSFEVQGDVPPARGLGSSVTLLAGIAAALDRIHRTQLGREEIAAMVSRIEGHPDNATASVLGGFCVARFCPRTADLRGVLRREIPDELAFVVVSPSLEMLTKDARGVLPADIPHRDAVRTVNSCAWLVAAMFAGDWASLRLATEDHLHQPHRLPRIPGGSAAIEAGLQAGAFGGWLSGSGSSVLCVAPHELTPAVLERMQAAFTSVSITSHGAVLLADNDGVQETED